MVYIPPPQYNPSNSDRFAQGVIEFLKIREARNAIKLNHERELEDMKLRKERFALEAKNTDHAMKMADLVAQRAGLNDAQSDAKGAFDFLQGTPGPVGDVSNGVSGIQGIPQFALDSALARATQNSPGASELAGMGPSPTPAPVAPRMDMSGANPVGQHPMIQYPMGGGQSVSARPQTDTQAIAEKARVTALANQQNLTKVSQEAEARAAAEAKFRKDPQPTTASLALEAAGGNAAKALKLVKATEARSTPPIGLQALPAEEQTVIRDLASRVAAGELTTSDARGLLGGVHGGRGVAFMQAIGEQDARLLPPVVRKGLTDVTRTKNLIGQAREMVDEIIKEPDKAEKLAKSIILENYTRSVGTMLARGFGETGAVTEGDRVAATGLVPGWKSSNFAPEFAYAKLKILDQMIANNENALSEGYFRKVPRGGMGTGTPTNRPPLSSFQR